MGNSKTISHIPSYMGINRASILDRLILSIYFGAGYDMTFRGILLYFLSVNLL